MEVCRECFANIHDLSNPTVDNRKRCFANIALSYIFETFLCLVSEG